jgi:hypothetical protein
VTVLLPDGAFEATWKVAVIWVSDTETPETVMPVPALIEALVPNPLPDMVTLVLAPMSPFDGEMLVMVGVTLVVLLPLPHVG